MSFLKGVGLGDVLGTISPAFGAVSGKGLGADLLPLLSPAAAMLGLGSQHSGHNETAEPVAPPAAPPPNAAASGLGHLLGVDPTRISSIAGDIGKGAAPFAAAGGAQDGQMSPLPVQNHLQLLDPQTLRALIAHFSGHRS